MNEFTFFVEPKIVMSVHGEWLATTPITSPLRIGVMGVTEDDARRKFEASLERWKEIYEHQKEKQAC